MKAAKLGIIAGGGQLPQRLAKACQRAGRELFVIVIEGEAAPEAFAGIPHAVVGVAKVGAMLDLLKRNECREVVMAGPISRPDFSSLKPDWQGIKLLPRVAKAAREGDDALLSVLVDFLGGHGFSVVGADDVARELLSDEGPLGAHSPDEADLRDIERAVEVVKELGRLDIGQGAVVRDGVVLGVEAAEGTDRLLKRCAEFREESRGGVLVKLCKPQQERRVDMPTIGLETIRNAAEAGLKGIAVEAGGALILDRDAVIAAADAAGLFVYGVTVDAG